MHEVILAVETYRHRSIGSFLRCASAFGSTTIIVVGSPEISTHGAHGAQNYVSIIHFYYWNDCVSYCRQRECMMYAVSPQPICQSSCELDSCNHYIPSPHRSNNLSASSALTFLSTSVDDFDFRTDSKSACFIVGNDGGLSTELFLIADRLFHVEVPLIIPHSQVLYDAKLAICMQKYATEVGLPERRRDGEKHLLGVKAINSVRLIKLGKKQVKTDDDTDGTNPDKKLKNHDALQYDGLSDMFGIET